MASLRVAGTDPGTGSLDLVILEDGIVHDQCRFQPRELQKDATAPVRWLEQRGPFALVVGPSGYGLPLVRAASCTARELALLSLVRADREEGRSGVAGFKAVVRAFCASNLPVVFLPGVIHLPTVARWRKLNRIDLGTPDKLSVAALMLWQRTRQLACRLEEYHGCLVELGSAFTACLVIAGGRIVDGLGGSSGPMGYQACGAWDGELAYLLSPLGKQDLFQGGYQDTADREAAQAAFTESLVRVVAGLRALTPFAELVISGRLLELESELSAELEQALGRINPVVRLPSLPGSAMKHAAQGAALLADGLAGGQAESLVSSLGLRQAQGTVLDHLVHPRAAGLLAQLGDLS